MSNADEKMALAKGAVTPSIEEALRSGAWRLVPVEATDGSPALIAKIMQYVDDIMAEAEVDYPAGREAGCRVSYDSDAIEKFIASALPASPDHTPALVALIEERDRLLTRLGQEVFSRTAAEAERDRLMVERAAEVVRREEANAYGDAEHARALAAEAERDALQALVSERSQYAEEADAAYDLMVKRWEDVTAERDALREALAGYAITDEFDFPGDAPEFCGFWCNECKDHIELDGSGHSPTCACVGQPPRTAEARKARAKETSNV